MSVLFKNNATATLAASVSSTATTIVLSSGLGALFPLPSGTTYFYGTLYDSLGNYEIVKCTARTSDSLTVVRGQEGTTALAFNIGDGFAQRLTAAGLNNFAQLDGTNNFTGTVTVPTPTSTDNSTNAATTAFVTAAIGAIPPQTGKVVQAITSGVFGSYSVSSGGSWQATGHVVNITPTSTASKILVMVHGGNNWNHNRADLLNNQTAIYRNGSFTGMSTDQDVYIYGADMSRGGVVDWTNSMIILDSPATTALLSYQVYVAGEFSYQGAVMVVMEIL